MDEKLQELALTVEAMRKAQNDFFRNRNNIEIKQELLTASKVLEGKVDDLVKNILHPEVENQTKMF